MPSLARGVQLLIDTHEGMQPLSMDIRGLIGEILRTVGWDRVEIFRFKGCPSWGVQCHPLQIDDRYHPPAAGRPVLIITDLGIGTAKESGARPSMATWRDYIENLKRSGTRATFLVPYSPKYWPQEFFDGMDLVVWDRITTVTALRRKNRPMHQAAPNREHMAFIHPLLASANPDAVHLGILASIATRIEPQLLRRLRLELAADLDVGAEMSLWLSDLVQERAPTGIVINPEIRTRLQHRLAQMPKLFDGAYRIIREAHRRSAPALQIEEELVYHILQGNTARVKELLRSIVATLVSPDRDGIAGWAGQTLLRIPREIKDLEETKLLATGAALRLGDSAALERMGVGGSAGINWLMPRQRETEISLNLRLGAIEFGPPAMRASHKILVPDTSMVIVELRWFEDDGKLRQHYIRIQPGQRRIYEIDSDALDLNIIGGHSYRLTTAVGEQRQSSQKFIGRNRPPRVQIEYDVELHDSLKKAELPFVIGVMAGLSGNAATAHLPESERRFIDIDVDNFDARMEKIQPGVAFKVKNLIDGNGEISIDLIFTRLAQFHPDSLVNKISPLNALHQQRKLLKELLAAVEGDPVVGQVVAELMKSGTMPSEGVSSDTTRQEASPVSEEIYEASHSVQQKSASFNKAIEGQISQTVQALITTYRRFPWTGSEDAEGSLKSLLREVDNLLSTQMREVIHHPAFQELEGSWRGLYYFVANTETDDLLKLKFLDISKEALLKSLDRYKGELWEHSPIFELIVTEAYGGIGGEPYGCLVGDYHFDHSPRDVTLLGEIGKIAAAAHCPFIAGAAPSVLGMNSWAELAALTDIEKRFREPNYAAWRSLRESEDSRYIGLTMPRFLARLPYGNSIDPTETFDFEESPNGTDMDRFVWANSAYAMAANIGRSFKLYGWCSRIRGVESGGAVEGLPMYAFPADDGGVDMKCPTEIAIGDRREAELAQAGFLPLVHRKNSDFAAFIGAQSLHKPAQYEDPDATANANLAARLPYLFACCRFAHYLKCLVRDNIGSFREKEDMQRWLQSWIMTYVDSDPAHSSEASKARKPLAAAEIVIEDTESEKGYYLGILYIRPHYQLEGLTVSLRTLLRLPSGFRS